MIDEGGVNAKISHADNMVRFESAAVAAPKADEVLARLGAGVDACVSLDARIADLDEEITLNPNFVKRSAVAPASTASHGKMSQFENALNSGHFVGSTASEDSTAGPASLMRGGGGVSSSSGGRAMNGGPVAGNGVLL